MDFKHDIVGNYGFDVNPETLAHDLTMMKLYKSDIPENTDGWDLYELYVQQHATIKAAIEDRTRYDTN